MVQRKEFQGKTLDDAIREACEYFGVAREKLEIEIVSDAKSGIFGLVGMKKAVILAGRVGSAVAEKAGGGEEALTEGQPAQKSFEESARKSASKSGGESRRSARGPAEQKKKQPPRREKPARPAQQRPQEDLDGEEGPARTEEEKSPASAPSAPGDAQPAFRDEMPEFSLEHCDRQALFATVQEVVLTLVRPIVGEVPCELSISGSRVRATLDCGEAAGLLVGRDGQTLASVQYLAARIISRRIGGALRLYVDAGKYRERQDDKFKEQALSLAARVKETGRPLSTRPLTAYQRRIVHLALEQDEAVQTHSKGEGAQRKVVISPRCEVGPEADTM